MSTKQREIEAQRRQIDRLTREIAELRQKIKILQEAGSGRNNIFVHIYVKCLFCGLHFQLLTERPEQHSHESMYCPECGQHGGDFSMSIAPGKGWIFEVDP